MCINRKEINMIEISFEPIDLLIEEMNIWIDEELCKQKIENTIKFLYPNSKLCDVDDLL
jgi:hypothetical protein